MFNVQRFMSSTAYVPCFYFLCFSCHLNSRLHLLRRQQLFKINRTGLKCRMARHLKEKHIITNVHHKGTCPVFKGLQNRHWHMQFEQFVGLAWTESNRSHFWYFSHLCCSRQLGLTQFVFAICDNHNASQLKLRVELKMEVSITSFVSCTRQVLYTVSVFCFCRKCREVTVAV